MLFLVQVVTAEYRRFGNTKFLDLDSTELAVRYEDFVLLVCDAPALSEWFPTFRNIVLPPR